MTTYAKKYNAVESTRNRIVKLYQDRVLTRPSVKNVTRTAVAIGLGIIEVAGLDPQKQVITLNVNFELKWCDDLLQWNTSEQACVKRNRSEILFTANEIWTPDVLAVNGPGQLSKGLKLQYPISVVCTGNVRWSYQEKLVAFCEIDVRNFPFDRQYCSILLQSTIYDSSQFKIRSLYNVLRLYNYITTEWEISHATIKEIDLYNAYHRSNFSTLQIDIELVRFSRFYILKIIVPFFIISTLAVFSFCLPIDSGEKIALTVSVLLSLVFYIQLISGYVPKTERGVCTLTLYSNGIFFIVFLSCIFNTFTIFIYYHEPYSRQPKKVRKRKKSIVFNVHKSLIELNKQRWKFLRKRKNIEENLPEQTDVDAIELLHDIRYFRQSLMNLFIRRNSLITTTSLDYQHPIFNPKSETKRSVKRIAMMIDRILFIIYLMLMPLSTLLLFHSAHQSRLASLTKTNSTNQLVDLRKSSIDPILLFRGCPT
ncbi:unnamed protein product [Adineta steineri]|uniref:Uncharacterized protein n=1 Tax=Adineta steineri TaxID=433720 RepID=A0A813RP81_9BILA|nr:unnamed protein product [Adineta steineri]CAF1042677.1 unnamed protein product [Adineta steineri]CAF1051629.1 unnamed protein product [Adineta steineri]